MQTIDLPLKNMHCQACESLVRLSLENENGVLKVESVDATKVKVNFDESKVEKNKLIQILKNLGNA
ncbi:copper chaperone [Candidatus Parcubacteria bacterium]|jgi:copper chaperone CopZ|nr:MAG: copper chaperone [Candidatus Parcubacteria bacterium]